MQDTDKIEIHKLLKYGFVVILIAVILNSLIYLLFDSFGTFSEDIINPNTGRPIPMSEIIIVSISQMLLGVVGFAFGTEIVKYPIRLYRRLAIVFLVLSFAVPFTIENVTVQVIIALEIMHLISGTLMIALLPNLIVEKVSAINQNVHTL